MKPKVSIVCITYNHEQFIKQALEGFVMQETNFPFEVIIHDDASTDNTAKIITDFQKKYPKIIKPIFQKENQFSKGKMPIVDFMLDKISGEYVAFCEGDDYWTDSHKLQMQVDFLDKHPECSICFHPVKIVWENTIKEAIIFPSEQERFGKTKLNFDDLSKRNFIQTNSVMYRWNLKKSEWPQQEFLPCDYLFHLIHAKKGEIGFINKVMGVYRKHAGGIWNGVGTTEEWFIRCGVLHARFYQILQEKFNMHKEIEIEYLVKTTMCILLKNQLFDDMKKLACEYPNIYQKLVGWFSSKEFENNNLKKIVRLKRTRRNLVVACVVLLIANCLIVWRFICCQ